jgi:phosphonate transport system permease protein
MTADSVPSRAARRPWGHFAALIVLGVAIVLSLTVIEWDVTTLLNAERRAHAMTRAGDLIASFAQPNLGVEWLERCWVLTQETLSVAVWAMLIAVTLAYPLAFGASLSVANENTNQRWLRSPRAMLCSLCRLVLDILRAIPDFAWAVILVAVLGLGPVTGAVALGLNITGILGKLYSETWDNLDRRAYEQVQVLGAGQIATFFYGIRPLAARSVLSFTLMRAECAIRNATVIGAVGGGGLGSEIMYQITMGSWNNVTTLLVFTLGLTLVADLTSTFIRRQLRHDPNQTHVSTSRGAARGIIRSYVGTGVVLGFVLWSGWFLGWGNAAGRDGQARNHLAPLGNLLSGEELSRLSFFSGLLTPDFDLDAWSARPSTSPPSSTLEHAIVAPTSDGIQLFAQYGPLDFYRAEAWAAWDKELSQWLVWRVVKSTAVPLAIAVIGTVLGVLGAILLTFPHSLAFQLNSQQFTGETPHVIVRAMRLVTLMLARLVGLIARGVPEVLWAFLLMAFFGPGVLAGALAITLHTMGVLLRVFSETIDNVPYRTFEQNFRGSRLRTFAAVGCPLVWRDWVTYVFFQFECNIRMGIVLGIVGVGGLGFSFSFAFEWFKFAEAGTYLLAMIVLTIATDRMSRGFHRHIQAT